MRKTTKIKLLSLLLISCLLVVVVPNRADAEVRLNKASKTVKVGQLFKLKVRGTKKKVKWKSSNKSVATVSKTGKVKAKKVGYATIQAKVAKRTLSCRITVISNFDATKALNNVEYSLNNMGSARGVVAIMKNKNSYSVSIDAKMVFYSNGVMVDTSSDNEYCFEGGGEIALSFYCDKEYDDFQINISISESIKDGYAKKIETRFDYGQESITAEIKNTSGKTLEFIYIMAVFYDSIGNVIGYDWHYAQCKEQGSVDYLTFDYPYDRTNFNTIIPSSCKLFVNHAY